MRFTLLFLIATFVNSAMAATCNAAYSALNRVYADAGECTVDGNKVVNSTSTCHCTTDCQIEVYMAEAGETCNNGTWSGTVEGVAVVNGCTTVGMSNYNAAATVDDGSCVAVVNGCTDSSASNYNALATADDGSCILNAMCDTFGDCPSGYSLRSEAGTISCTDNPCVGLATDHTVKSGTNYGQYAPKQDKDRCCDYVNQEFTYVEHDKNTDGTWKTVAEGGTGGCLSDKCYAKSVTKGNGICSWGSGACKRCNYCNEDTDFTSGPNCTPKCAKYKDLTTGFGKNDAFCRMSLCHGCEYCTGRAAKCSDSSFCPAGYDPKPGTEDTKCKGATCTDRHDRDTCCVEHSDFTTGPNCNPKCAKYKDLTTGFGKNDAFCRMSLCHGCEYCTGRAAKCSDSSFCPAGYDPKPGTEDTKCKGATCTDRHDRDTCCVEHSDFTTGPNCNPKCAKYKDLTTGIGKNDEFCCWRSGICSGCSYCAGKCNQGRRLRAEFKQLS